MAEDKKPSEQIREIWQELKELKRFYGFQMDPEEFKKNQARHDYLQEKYESVITLFGAESTLSIAQIYYLDECQLTKLQKRSIL